MKIHTVKKSFKSDLITPVSLYLKIRNSFRKPVLMESNDYHSRTESKSIVAFDPLIEIIVGPDSVQVIAGNKINVLALSPTDNIDRILGELMQQFKPENDNDSYGFFSYFGFEYAHFSECQIVSDTTIQRLPSAHLILYKYLIVLDHFHDTGQFIVNKPAVTNDDTEHINMDEILRLQPGSTLPFQLTGTEKSQLSDTDFLDLVKKAKEHILRGDVFQLVVSREFEQPFFGDDFQVYRELRSLNPSPYLFYADFESHRIFGSSPEKQLHVQNGVAEIHPIAGTVRKTGDEQQDKLAISHLISDDKENAEHTMLVDLARNDLSKYCSNVKVVNYKEIQQFSHVIHLVSKVAGNIESGNPFDLFSGTFPAGTLSGTPKPKALELINEYEPGNRDYYGGAIGFVGFNADMNLAIIIRSVFSKNNRLYFRAGAGVVLDSIPENELDEVKTKLGAVRKAIAQAGTVVTNHKSVV